MYYEIVLAGVAISLLFVELTGLSPAGLIVPGYLALCLQTPWRIVYTLAVAVAAWGIAKLLGNVMILYGRPALCGHGPALLCHRSGGHQLGPAGL